MKRLLLQLTVLLALFAPACAQIEVGLEIKRRIFLRGEPIEAKVTIRNLAGHDITLRDLPSHQWFGFEIIRRGDTPVAPNDPDYKNEPVVIPSGQSTATIDVAIAADARLPAANGRSPREVSLLFRATGELADGVPVISEVRVPLR